MIAPFNLKDRLDPDKDIDLTELGRTANAIDDLNDRGHGPRRAGHFDKTDAFQRIADYQHSRGLKVDSRMQPKGPTAKRIAAETHLSSSARPRRIGIPIKQGVGPGQPNRAADVRAVAHGLTLAGHRAILPPTAKPDAPDPKGAAAIHAQTLAMQRAQGEKADGVVKRGGPTQSLLGYLAAPHVAQLAGSNPERTLPFAMPEPEYVGRTLNLRPTTIRTFLQDARTLPDQEEHEAATSLLKINFTPQQANTDASSGDVVVGGADQDTLGGGEVSEDSIDNRSTSETSQEKSRTISANQNLSTAETQIKDQPIDPLVERVERDLQSKVIHVGHLQKKIIQLEESVRQNPSPERVARLQALQDLLSSEVKRQSKQLGAPFQPGSAQSRLSRLDLTIVSDDHEGSLSGGQVTRSEYNRMLEESQRTDEWTFGDATRDAIQNGLSRLGLPAPADKRDEYRDNWVAGHATTIQVLSRKYGLPPESLAFIAWRELGGDPDVQDDLLLFPFHKANKERGWKISAGDVSIQLRHIARMQGRAIEDLDLTDAYRILNQLQEDQVFNLEMVARHLAEIRDEFWPEEREGRLSDKQLMELGYVYGAGAARLRDAKRRGGLIFDKQGDVRTPDDSAIVNGRQRMLALLGIKN